MAKKNARNSDPATSKEAAETVDARSQMLLLLEAFAWADSTDAEAAERAEGVDPWSGWWKRCSDLRREGWIEWVYDENGNLVRRKGKTGRSQGVSRVTNAGYKVLASS